jgi:branched-chain amino acid transport system permease protein
MQAALAGPAPDIREFAKRAVLAGIVTLVLSCLLIGIEAVSTTTGLEIHTRYRAVFCASIGVALVYFFSQMTHAGKPLPAIVGGVLLLAGFGVLEAAYLNGSPLGDQLPFEAQVVNWAAAIIPLSLVLRGLYVLWAKTTKGTVRSASQREAGFATFYLRYNKAIGLVLIVFALALPFMPFANRRLIDVATLVVTYIMLGWGLNIVVGLAGLLDLGYVAFYAVGAYTYAMLSTDVGLSFWFSLPIAGAMAASFGILLGFPVLRLRGDYLAIVTLGFGEMIRVILTNWWWFTGGPNGINNVARPSFFGLPFERDAPPGVTTFATFFHLDYSPNQRVFFLYFLILIFALVTNFFTLRIRRLPIGRAWEALREDETACRALGINPRNTKLTAFAIGAMFAGMAGSFFAARQGFVSPESFVFLESAVILAIVVLGGLGTQIGVVLAAVVLIGMPEFFRELQDYRMIAFGIGMVLIMIWRPGGILSHRDPTIFLNRGKAKS